MSIRSRFHHSCVPRAIGRCVVLALAPLVVSGVSHAQATGSVETISTDTGDFAPGRISLSHYTTPQLCMAAAVNAGLLAQRTYEEQITADRLSRTPLADTLPTRTVSVARGCLRRFSVDGVAARDLPEIQTLALMAGQDVIAQSAVTRWLSAVPDPSARDSARLSAMNNYLEARPARAEAAASLFDRIAQSGAAGDWSRLVGADRMLEFWRRVFDHNQIRSWAPRVIAGAAALSAGRFASEAKYSLWHGYAALAELTYVDVPDSMPSLAGRAQQDLRRFHNDSLNPFSFDPQTATVEYLEQALSPIPATWRHAGESYPALHADRWFPSMPSSRGPTLVISTEADWVGVPPLYGGARCLSSDFVLLYRATEDCAPLYEWIRDLAAHDPSQRLTIVLATATHGEVVRSLPLTPPQEADRLRWYVLDYLKLPVTLAVVNRSPYEIAKPDGRRLQKFMCMSPFPDAPQRTDSSEVACRYLAVPLVLLDDHDALVYAGPYDPLFDALLSKTLTSTASPRPISRSSHE